MASCCSVDRLTLGFDIIIRPAQLTEVLIPRFRADLYSNVELGIPVRLDEAGLAVFITLGIKGGGPEP